MTSNEDDFDILDDTSEATGEDDLLSNFDEPYLKEVAKELRKVFSVTDEDIIKAIKESLKEIDSDHIDEVKKTLVTGKAHTALQGQETSENFDYFVTGVRIKQYQDDISMYVLGAIAMEDGDDRKYLPATIGFSNVKEDTMKKLSNLSFFSEYSLFTKFNEKEFEIKNGKLEPLRKSDYLKPFFLYASDITNFEEEIDKPNIEIDDLYDSMYGIKMNVTIDYGKFSSGISKIESGKIKDKDTTWHNRNDIKLILIHPESDPEPHFGSQYMSRFNGHTYKENASVQVVGYNHKQLMNFNRSEYDLIIAGSIKKNTNSKYSEYEVEMYACQPILRSKVNKYVG